MALLSWPDSSPSEVIFTEFLLPLFSILVAGYGPLNPDSPAGLYEGNHSHGDRSISFSRNVVYRRIKQVLPQTPGNVNPVLFTDMLPFIVQLNYMNNLLKQKHVPLLLDREN
jgi:hypothetical protein